MKRLHTYAVASALALLAATPVLADLIVRTDGTVLEGTIVTRDAKGLTVQLDAQKTQPPLQLPAASVTRVIVIDEHGAALTQAAGIDKPAKRPDPVWSVPKEPAAPPIVAPAKDPTYYLIPLHGPVGETFLADALEKSLADAVLRKPNVVVLDIDSPGGLINEAQLMMKILHKYNKELRIVALVDQDLSAAAITSLSVRAIYMKSTATLGAATAFNAVNPDMPQDIQEKMQSVWRAVARNSAEEGGHDPLFAQAMIDSSLDLHIETIDGKKVVKEGPGPNMLVTKGKILTLTSHEAVNCGLAADIADDLAELGDELNFKGWKECPGLGTILAKYIPTRRDAFIEKAKALEADFKENLRAAQASAPSEELVTRSITTGGSPAMPGRVGPVGPVGPAGRGAGGAGGMGGARGAGGAGGRAGRMAGGAGAGGPQRVVTQQVLTVTPEQRAQWQTHSLATVIAIQKMEQNLLDEISLSQAYGQKGLADQLKDPLASLADVRTKIYSDRNKYANDAPPARPVPPTPPTPPVASNPPRGPAPAAAPSATPALAPTGPTEQLTLTPVTSAAAPELALKNAPLAAPFSAAIKSAIDAKTFKVGPFIAGIFARDEFQDITSDGGLLIGLRCGLHGSDKNAVVASVQPVFLTPKGVVLGTLHGDPKATPVVDMIARDGYAVCGARIGGNINLEGLALRFMRIKGQGLDPTDLYETDYIGNFSPPTVIDAPMAIIGITGRTNTQGHLGLGFVFMPQPLAVKYTPLPAAFADTLKQALSQKKYKASNVVSGGLAREPFEDLPPDGGILVGLRCAMGKFVNTPVIASVQPIYLTAKGTVLGTVHGDPHASPVTDLLARDGYVVGAMKLAGPANLEGLQLTFVRLAGAELNPADAYDSDPLGNIGKTTTLTASTPVLGLAGKSNNGTSLGLGLITLTP